MNKQLTPLEALNLIAIGQCKGKRKQYIGIIAKELKALEIIKEIDKTSLLHFIAINVKDNDKYELLKEVLL